MHALVLLETDGPPERDLLSLDRDPVVAVVEDHLDVRRHDRHPDSLAVEQLGPFLVAKRGVHVAEHKPDRKEEVGLARTVPADDDLRRGAGGSIGPRAPTTNRSTQRAAQCTAKAASATDAAAKRAAGIHTGGWGWDKRSKRLTLCFGEKGSQTVSFLYDLNYAGCQGTPRKRRLQRRAQGHMGRWGRVVSGAGG